MLIAEGVKIRTGPANAAERAKKSSDGSFDRAPSKVRAMHHVVGGLPGALEHHGRDRPIPNDGRVIVNNFAVDGGARVKFFERKGERARPARGFARAARKLKSA